MCKFKTMPNNAQTNNPRFVCVCSLVVRCEIAWNLFFKNLKCHFMQCVAILCAVFFGDQWPLLEANTVLFLFFFRYISFIINAARFSAVIFDAITFTVDRWLCVVRFSCDLIVWVSFCRGEIERPTNRSNSIEQQTRYGTRLWFFLYSAIS